MQIPGKFVLITGASSGIGAATAELCGRRQARLALVARSENRLAEVARLVEQNGAEAHVFPADLSQESAIPTLVNQIAATIGTPDVLINNAGAGRWLFAEETAPDEVRAMMAVPYFAAFWLTSAFLPGMLARGSGHIVNINSFACFAPWAGATGYAAARWALRGFTEALQADLYHTPLGVSHVVAGEVESGYWAHNAGSRERLPAISRLFPIQTPAQVARVILSAVEKEPREVIASRRLSAIRLLLRFFPGLLKHLVWETGYHPSVRTRVDQAG